MEKRNEKQKPKNRWKAQDYKQEMGDREEEGQTT
jgi:hypothetical protein